ncbi:jg8042 [Pararge aegeria aegeria]|uniref:Jg8042 protein n=1 Tax=Pararge aegeria aegeria TaxID=348720 RepID=A0A8S4RKQ9_9NEOP|nr:jg8042 [Pararge aegeria aegeria]
MEDGKAFQTFAVRIRKVEAKSFVLVDGISTKLMSTATRARRSTESKARAGTWQSHPINSCSTPCTTELER